MGPVFYYYYFFFFWVSRGQRVRIIIVVIIIIIAYMCDGGVYSVYERRGLVERVPSACSIRSAGRDRFAPLHGSLVSGASHERLERPAPCFTSQSDIVRRQRASSHCRDSLVVLNFFDQTIDFSQVQR